MEVGGQDLRPEPLDERRKRLAKLLRAKNKPCGKVFSSARGSLETMPLSFAMPAVWALQAWSRSGSDPVM